MIGTIVRRRLEDDPPRTLLNGLEHQPENICPRCKLPAQWNEVRGTYECRPCRRGWFPDTRPQGGFSRE